MRRIMFILLVFSSWSLYGFPDFSGNWEGECTNHRGSFTAKIFMDNDDQLLLTGFGGPAFLAIPIGEGTSIKLISTSNQQEGAQVSAYKARWEDTMLDLKYYLYSNDKEILFTHDTFAFNDAGELLRESWNGLGGESSCIYSRVREKK